MGVNNERDTKDSTHSKGPEVRIVSILVRWVVFLQIYRCIERLRDIIVYRFFHQSKFKSTVALRD